MGWKVTVSVPDFPKCIICVAPHTSNLDFIIGKAGLCVDRTQGRLPDEKHLVFLSTRDYLQGHRGVPVYRDKRKGDLTRQLIDRFNSASRLALAITPEGTRSLTSKWHTGFLPHSRRHWCAGDTRSHRLRHKRCVSHPCVYPHWRHGGRHESRQRLLPTLHRPPSGSIHHLRLTTIPCHRPISA